MANSSELDKQRNIVFSPLPEGQLIRAQQFLALLPGCKADIGNIPHTLSVTYHLRDHTLEELENRLIDEGFILDSSMLRNIERNIIYYCEDTICHNMDVPAHPTKKNEREIFVKAYEHESLDETNNSPPELQNYK